MFCQNTVKNVFFVQPLVENIKHDSIYHHITVKYYKLEVVSVFQK